jgi:hypothetical protein
VEATVEVLSQTAVSYDGAAGTTALPAECALLTPPLLQRQASLLCLAAHATSSCVYAARVAVLR